MPLMFGTAIGGFKQLRTLAGQQGISLKGLTRKADIIRAFNQPHLSPQRPKQRVKQTKQRGGQTKQADLRPVGSVMADGGVLVIGDVDAVYKLFSQFRNMGELWDFLGPFQEGQEYQQIDPFIFINRRLGSEVKFNISTGPSHLAQEIDGTILLKESDEPR